MNVYSALNEASPLSIHDALPIWRRQRVREARGRGGQARPPRAGRRLREVVPRPGLLRQRRVARHQAARRRRRADRSEEHTSELQSRENLVCRLLLEKKKKHVYNK